MTFPRAELSDGVRSLRILILALAGGVAFMTIVAVAVDLDVGGGEGGNDTLRTILPLVVLGLAFVNAGVFLVLRMTFRNRLRARLAEEPDLDEAMKFMPPEYQALTITAAALAESVGLLAAIAYLLLREPVVLVAAGIAVALILALMPSEQRVRDFVASATRESF